ncbi:ArsR/SmtB family transcription factor [Cytobacillus sp. Hz8]|uniref:ArsR/SmtB family transcription factor n=1 Tax=Cytobacillus sp. Hz8 TaxID=3347168 RepID=UPI0035DF8699
MKDIYYIESLEQLKVLSDPFRVRIIWELDESAKTGKMLADLLELSPSKMRYHLTELEKVGLIEIERTEIKNGIVQKFFRPIAKIISLEKMYPVINGDTSSINNSLIENALLLLEKAKINLRKINAKAFNPGELIQIFDTLSLTEVEFQEFKIKLNELKSSFQHENHQGKKKYQIYVAAFPEGDEKK